MLRALIVGRPCTTVPCPVTRRMFRVSATAISVGRFLGTVVMVNLTVVETSLSCLNLRTIFLTMITIVVTFRTTKDSRPLNRPTLCARGALNRLMLVSTARTWLTLVLLLTVAIILIFRLVVIRAFEKVTSA